MASACLPVIRFPLEASLSLDMNNLLKTSPFEIFQTEAFSFASKVVKPFQIGIWASCGSDGFKPSAVRIHRNAAS
eukprot:4675733-Amphidinium_carterae.1